ASNRASGTPDLIRYVIAAVVLIALFSGVTRFVLRRRKRATPVVSEEERTTLRPVFDLSRWLARLRDVFGRRHGELIHDPLDALRGDPRWAATVSIRERYREMLVWAEERGAGRSAGTTPAEHGTMLITGLAGTPPRVEIATMTDIYTRARYGAAPAPEEDAIAIETAWRRLYEAGQVER
ncbi:MAG: DUF4129 domain-containing protein, partial [Thermomicrobiales bacterium]|nr:DUF4129 domain-containing protein [Thermomicrobiales bacterium]